MLKYNRISRYGDQWRPTLSGLIVALVLVGLCSCGVSSRKTASTQHDENDFFHYASGISIAENPHGWYEVKIYNPWDTTTLLQQLVLLPSTIDSLSKDIPQGITIVKTPLHKTLVQSTVHVGLFEEMGALDAIAGISDAPFIKSGEAKNRLAAGSIVDCGGWMSPDLERIINLQPDAIFVSPYQDGGNYGKVTELGFPIVFVADYMEKNPLGRAEWIKYYGLLLGKELAADSIFSSVESKYNAFKNACKEEVEAKCQQEVLMDTPHGDSWYVPARGSANDNFINAAGAINPFSYISNNQFSSLSPETVLAEAHDADVWIIRLNSVYPLSLDLLKQQMPFVDNFKAYREGNVWGCNTNTSTYYEDTPFHPELVMEDLYNIFYADAPADTLNYFNRLK